MAKGEDLRALRKSKSLTLAAVASAMGKSLGWMSQVERGISQLEAGDLPRLARVLGVSPDLLRAPQPACDREAGRIVRSDQRRTIGTKHPGLFETLVSPDLTDNFEIIHARFEAGAARRDLVHRQTQEIGYLLQGRLDLIISGERYRLEPGDSFRIRDEPYRWLNPYDEDALAIWVISPPVY